MRSASLVLACLALLCAMMLVHSSAQSGRAPSSQPTSIPTPTPNSQSSKSGIGSKTVALDVPKYRVVFAPNANMDSFIDQLNQNSEGGYRLKTATYSWQRLSGDDYSIPVGILQSDESEFEYSWFEVTTTTYLGIPGFERRYAGEAKKGFRVVDHFLSNIACADDDSDTVTPIPYCTSSYIFLLERERGAHNPRDFIVAEAVPDWRRKPGGTLVNVMMQNLPDGYYPARILSNNQILLHRTTDKEDFETDALEAQVVTSSFLNNVKKKVNELGRQGFRLALIGKECAVMYRRPNEHGPVAYEWLNAKNKRFEKELARIQASAAVFRLVYRDPYNGNQLVFERQAKGSARSVEYKALRLTFQLLERPSLKDVGRVPIRVDLTPESKETVKLINNLAGEGFAVRGLFVSNIMGSRNVGVLLERSR